MSRWRITLVAIATSLLFGAMSSDVRAVVDVRTRKVTGNLPKPAAVSFASGSGVIVGKRHVLTNRHIVQDDKKAMFDGFRVFTGPDYKKSNPGKVIAICDNYDLALIETSADLPFNGVTVLDDLPPLALRVTAYGFPLGSRFGVGLTTTGGQVSRHPVASTPGQGKEDAEVRSALWHDAILTSGNSGGPLFATSKVLVGINFAYLNTGSKHALAVPANVVSEFLRRSSAKSEVTFSKSAEDAGKGDPQAMTVFIESMVDDITKRAPDLAAASSVSDVLTAKLKTRLPVLTPSALKRVEGGELHLAFSPVKVASVEAGDVVRLQGDISINGTVDDDDGIVAVVDDVFCVMLLPPEESAALRTKLAKNAKDKVALDQLYFVGPPVTVRTSRGPLFALVFLSLNRFADSTDFKQLVEEEKVRRGAKAEGTAEAATTTTAVVNDEKEARAVAQFESRLRRTFTDATGKFRIEAVPVKITATDVELIRMDDKRKLPIAIAKLSADDRIWLRDNEKWIALYGPRLEKSYTAAATSGSAN
jgi:S1-C subfamily serine protease